MGLHIKVALKRIAQSLGLTNIIYPMTNIRGYWRGRYRYTPNGIGYGLSNALTAETVHIYVASEVCGSGTDFMEQRRIDRPAEERDFTI